MARIRTIKPDFFRHEGLQDLEADNPGSYIMLTFAGLWTICDKEGRFEWRPRIIKLDILPFLDFDMEDTLMLLQRFSYVSQYEIDGKIYGLVHEFKKHQRINGKEAQDPPRYPDPIEFNNLEKGSNGEAIGKQQGSREREGKGKGKGKGMDDSAEHSLNASPPAARLILNDKTYHDVTEHDVLSAQELYPAVNIRQELRNMIGWCEANPKRRKTRAGIKKFINTWLAKEQDKYHGGQIEQPPPLEWHQTATGIIEKGKEHGLNQEDFETFPYFKQAVMKAVRDK